jgi:hypothetical protein
MAVAPGEPAVVARALALKLRSLFENRRHEEHGGWRALEVPASVGRAAGRRAGAASAPVGAEPPATTTTAATATPTPAATATPTPAATTPPPAPVATAPAAPVATPPAVAGPRPAIALDARRAAPPPARPPRLEAGVGYLLALPSDTRWLAHDVGLRLGAPLGRLPLAVELDGAVGSRPGVGPPGYRVTVYDLPFGLALVGRLRLGRWLFAGGPRASLHVFSAGADAADGRSGAAHKLSAGLGAVAEVRLALTDWLAAQLTVTGEALLPEQQFTVDGAVAASPGPFAFGACAGLVFRAF